MRHAATHRPQFFYFINNTVISARNLMLILRTWFLTTDGAPEQFVLWDLTLRDFVVSSTSIGRARVINWKSVCTVLCCCVHCVEIYTEQREFADSFDFLFNLKKTDAESYRLLREAYGEFAPTQDTCERWFRRFKSGYFEVADKEHGKP